MRIVCDSCGTKYSISDDKVRGKVFKIRCKNCSHVIIVRGDNNAGAQESAGAPAAAAAAGGGEAVWYIVRGGQQDGPYTEADVGRFVSSGEINAETYAWREGFADWLPLASAEGLSHLVQAPMASVPVAAAAPAPAPEPSYHNEPMAAPGGPQSFDDDHEATRVVSGFSFNESADAAAPAAAAAAVSAASLGGIDSGSMGAVAAAQAPAPVAEAGPIAGFGGGLDLGGNAPASEMGELPSLSGLASLSGSSLDSALSQDPVPQAAKPSGSLSVRNSNADPDMVGARNEDSVLFSLNSLSSGPAVSEDEGPSNTEASGLIDIKALSSSAAAVSSGRDAGGPAPVGDPFGGNSAGPAIAMPAMMPMGTRKSNAPLFIGIAAGLFFLLLLGGLVVYLAFFRAPAEPQVVVKNEAAATANANPEGDKAAAADDKKDEEVAKDDKADEEEKDDKATEEEGDGEEDAVAENDGEGEGDKADEEEGDSKDTKLAKNDKGSKDKGSREDRAAREKRLEELARKKDKDNAKKNDTPAAPKKDTKPRKGGNDAIDDILSGIGGNKKPPAKKDNPAPTKPADPPPVAAKKKLDKSQVQRTIRGAYGRVAACNNAGDKKSGTVTVRFTIQPSGSVGGAQVTGPFAGTPVGGCIARVVRGLRFPSFDGSPLTITFPFVLR